MRAKPVCRTTCKDCNVIIIGKDEEQMLHLYETHRATNHKKVRAKKPSTERR